MKKKKTFDCVEMKNEIQAKLLKRYEGMSDEEIRADQDRRLSADPILGPLWKKARSSTRD